MQLVNYIHEPHTLFFLPFVDVQEASDAQGLLIDGN